MNNCLSPVLSRMSLMANTFWLLICQMVWISKRNTIAWWTKVVATGHDESVYLLSLKSLVPPIKFTRRKIALIKYLLLKYWFTGTIENFCWIHYIENLPDRVYRHSFPNGVQIPELKGIFLQIQTLYYRIALHRKFITFFSCIKLEIVID